MRLFCLLVGFIWSHVAYADMPQPDYSSLKEGVIFVYERENGSRYASKLTSISSEGYVFENRNGEDGAGSFISRSTFTPDGKRLVWEGPEDTWVYKPHGCNRVLGDCVYKTQKSTGGKSYRNTMSTSYSNGKAKWKRYYNGGVVSSGWYEIDPETSWVSAFGWSSTNGGGETAKLVRVDQP